MQHKEVSSVIGGAKRVNITLRVASGARMVLDNAPIRGNVTYHKPSGCHVLPIRWGRKTFRVKTHQIMEIAPR